MILIAVSQEQFPTAPQCRVLAALFSWLFLPRRSCSTQCFRGIRASCLSLSLASGYRAPSEPAPISSGLNISLRARCASQPPRRQFPFFAEAVRGTQGPISLARALHQARPRPTRRRVFPREHLRGEGCAWCETATSPTRARTGILSQRFCSRPSSSRCTASSWEGGDRKCGASPFL